VSLLIYKISKWIQNDYILDRISFYLPKGCLAALIGPSGSGKSTLLRVIAGLETDMSGSIWLNERESTHIPIQYRQMGFVFQNFALFQHMTVTENIAFGLKLRYLSPYEIHARVTYLLEALRITDIALQYPHQLSGGQKQRVALARSLAVEPQFLLLDEPFKALDSELRTSLGRWLKVHLAEKEITTLMVTHDQTEALSIADEVLILNQGRLIQQAKPDFIYDNPINDLIGEFVGPLLPKSVRLWSVVTLRSYELKLSRIKLNDSHLVKIQRIVYKRHVVELYLWLISNRSEFMMELGYKSYAKLSIKNNSEFLYLSLA
jgi:sulfate transport system ATP-binding protein